MKEKNLPAIERGLNCIRLCAQRGGGVSFSLFQEELQLSPATLSRLLAVLTDLQYLSKREDGYRLGSRAVLLSEEIAAASRNDSIRLQPVIDALAEKTRESAAFFELDGKDRMIILCKREMPDSYHYMQLFTGWGPPLEQDCFGLVCLIDAGGSDPADKRLTVKNVRAELDRYGACAMERHLKGHIIRVCAPVRRGAAGEIVGSIGITLPAGQGVTNNLDARREDVAASAELASRILG
jgi:DNA-binding IclR family transcriptional regulator